MTFEEFKKNPMAKVKVYDIGIDKNLILKLTEEGDRYVTRNMGNSKRKVFHYWDMERVYNAAISHDGKHALFVDEIKTRVQGKSLYRMK
ncbi:hypothetical protein ABE073_04205 [Lederbergia citrisecunda]|uniref:hypothetical protein n=1 Tax=Lederbergia citrisecunda TaxID=2833583 RepID=UPI003D28536C